MQLQSGPLSEIHSIHGQQLDTGCDLTDLAGGDSSRHERNPERLAAREGVVKNRRDPLLPRFAGPSKKDRRKMTQFLTLGGSNEL
ncbi:hypothetical protein N657DRAFT_640062, partial [Parathielavia appendiculata]